MDSDKRGGFHEGWTGTVQYTRYLVPCLLCDLLLLVSGDGKGDGGVGGGGG